MGLSFNGLSGAAVTLSGTVTSQVAGALSAARTPVVKGITKNPPTAHTAFTLHTVTATKTLYVTTITVQGSGAMSIGDNTGNITPEADSGGGQAYLLINAGSTTGATNTITLPTPMKFTTSVQICTANATACYVSIAGWEE